MESVTLRPLLIITFLVVLFTDLFTKHLAIKYLAFDVNLPPDLQPYGKRVTVIPGFFDLLFAKNPGGAFSFLHQHTWIITLISGLMILAMTVWAFTIHSKKWFIQLTFGLILGGAIGNLVDRLRFQYVVDFLHFYIIRDGKEHFWPTFNIADVGIVCGIGIFMFLSLFTKEMDPPAKTEPQNLQISDSPAENSVDNNKTT